MKAEKTKKTVNKSDIPICEEVPVCDMCARAIHGELRIVSFGRICLQCYKTRESSLSRIDHVKTMAEYRVMTLHVLRQMVYDGMSLREARSIATNAVKLTLDAV